MRRNIIISGASGFIGTGILDLLKDRNEYKVFGIYNKKDPVIKGNNIIYLEGDLTQQKIWKKIKDLDVYAFIHCAAKIPRSFCSNECKESRRLNLEMDKLVISYIEENIKLIYISSSSVYGMVTDKVCNEEADLDPINEYAKGKAESESKIKKNISKYLILRISAPYGPYQLAKTVLKTFIIDALHNKPLSYYGSGSRMQDFTYIKDVANACMKALTSEKYGIYNIASGTAISMKDLTFVIKKLTNSKSEIRAANIEDPQELYRPRFDISKAKQLLNWHPVYSLEKGLGEFIEYIKRYEL